MGGHLLDILHGQKASVPQQNLLQLRHIQLSLVFRRPGLPVQRKAQAHGGIHIPHQLRHVRHPSAALRNPVRKLLADGLGKDVFEQLPVLLLNQKLRFIDGIFQDLIKLLQIHLFPIPYGGDAHPFPNRAWNLLRRLFHTEAVLQRCPVGSQAAVVFLEYLIQSLEHIRRLPVFIALSQKAHRFLRAVR